MRPCVKNGGDFLPINPIVPKLVKHDNAHQYINNRIFYVSRLSFNVYRPIPVMRDGQLIILSRAVAECKQVNSQCSVISRPGT